MIKRLRRRFIFAAMLAMSLVLFVIIAATNIMNYISVVRESDRLLSDVISPDRPASDVPVESRFFYVTLKADGEVESTQMNDMISIGSDKASSMARKIVKAKKQRGFCSYFRYLIYNSASGEKVVCFLDCQRSLSNARSFLLISIAASLAGEAAVFALILFFSERIVAPIEESYQKQRRFITDAGHELKTPITIIDADIAVLESEKGEDEWTADMKRQTERMARLTADLTYLSRMEEGIHAEMIEFPLSDLLDETVASFMSRARIMEKTISSDIEPMVTMIGDQDLIRELIVILLDNAIKYSSEKSEIRVGLLRNKNIILTVTNRVDSVDREMLNRMFDRFYRASASRNSSEGGFGIGLSMALSITQMHGGRIRADSPDDHSIRITAIFNRE